MKVALCPGSFDPITRGHLDIIERAAGLFDKVVVLIAVNPDKKTDFTVDERTEMIRAVTAGMQNVEVDSHTGLLVDYAKRVGATVTVRGLRAISDFEFEFQMALANAKLYGELETVFLNTRSEYMYLSSSLVKQIAAFGGDIADLVPAALVKQVQQRLNRGGNEK